MARTRISTTVDSSLLELVRSQTGLRDSELFDLALEVLNKMQRDAEIDQRILDGYEQQPLDTPDAWGDLESFQKAVRKANNATTQSG